MAITVTMTSIGWVAMTPLSLAGLAALVQNGALPRVGGDDVLRRAGFRWGERGRAARGLTWHEADALCRHVGGRLPWYDEWRWLAAPPSRGHAAGQVPPIEGYQAGPRAFVSGTGVVVEGDLGEWCGDWYHPDGSGPDVRAEPPLRRRVGGWRLPAVSPAQGGPEIGVRLVLPSNWQPSRAIPGAATLDLAVLA